MNDRFNRLLDDSDDLLRGDVQHGAGAAASSGSGSGGTASVAITTTSSFFAACGSGCGKGQGHVNTKKRHGKADPKAKGKAEKKACPVAAAITCRRTSLKLFNDAKGDLEKSIDEAVGVLNQARLSGGLWHHRINHFARSLANMCGYIKYKFISPAGPRSRG